MYSYSEHRSDTLAYQIDALHRRPGLVRAILFDDWPLATDHVGTPKEVLDEQRRPVWQAVTTAFGKANVIYPASGTGGKPFEMNLRLPGQVYDAETGLHYNYYRDYDPASGRYTTPDPARIGAGQNPYLYAANNIDDNPDTRPLDPNYFSAAWDLVFNGAEARNRLATYHFTQQPSDDVSADLANRFDNPGNDQLVRLFNASIKAGEVGSVCAKAQMYGEYLHAFEDTFSHRKADDTPIGINSGLGHATSGHLPDYTYNTDMRTTDPDTGVVSGPYWPNNEARTLEMEHEVFDSLSSTWADGKSKAMSWGDIEPLLAGPDGFNAIKENSGNTHNFDSSVPGYTKKIDILNNQLNAWGYRFVDVGGKSKDLNLEAKGQGQYREAQGADDRDEFLRYSTDESGHKAGDKFQQSDFNRTILK